MNLFHTKEPFVFYVKMGDLPIRNTTTGRQKSQGHLRLWQFGFDRQLVFFAPESTDQIGGADQANLSLNSEIEEGRAGAFWGAHASGVWFSASRRKPRPANFFATEISGIVGDQSSGATPELARGTRALPHSCFGVRVKPLSFTVARQGKRI